MLSRRFFAAPRAAFDEIVWIGCAFDLGFDMRPRESPGQKPVVFKRRVVAVFHPCYFVETANLAAQNDEIAWIDSVSGKTGGARLVSRVQAFERPVPPARGRLDASSLGQAGFGCLASCARGLLDALSDKRGFLPVSHDCCHSPLAG